MARSARSAAPPRPAPRPILSAWLFLDVVGAAVDGVGVGSAVGDGIGEDDDVSAPDVLELCQAFCKNAGGAAALRSRNLAAISTLHIYF